MKIIMANFLKAIDYDPNPPLKAVRFYKNSRLNFTNFSFYSDVMKL